MPRQPPVTSGTAASAPPGQAAGEAWFRGVRARGAVEFIELDGTERDAFPAGFWAVVADFEGTVRAWRFEHVERTGPAADAVGQGTRTIGRPAGAGTWTGPAPSAWESSLGAEEYRDAVRHVRDRIRDGDVYQVNLCRVLSAPLPPRDGREPAAGALAVVLEGGNPAPYAGGIHVPDRGTVRPAWVVSASPELFLSVRDGMVTSGPIKGTAPSPAGLTDKDRAENIMITDMVRNDLQQACEPGTVEVSELLSVESHPGLAHLVTRVRGRLTRTPPDWSALLRATYPPASVSGAPKHAALGLIRALEPVPRGPYCGAVGWIDADAGQAELAVGIRTFWWTGSAGGRLCFGTGAGITWGSDPQGEWAETELKAHRLVALASTGG